MTDEERELQYMKSIGAWSEPGNPDDFMPPWELKSSKGVKVIYDNSVLGRRANYGDDRDYDPRMDEDLEGLED